MGESIIFMILLQVVLIALNAVFACAEIAIISMNDNKMNKMAAEGNKKAKRLVKLTEEPARFLSTIQIAITLSGFLGSAFAAENFSDVLVDVLIGWGVPVPAEVLESVAVSFGHIGSLSGANGHEEPVVVGQRIGLGLVIGQGIDSVESLFDAGQNGCVFLNIFPGTDDHNSYFLSFMCKQ